MTQPEDNLDLPQVRERFLEAEERLRELAQSAVNLSRMSVQLKEARLGVADASQVLRETGDQLASFIEVLSSLSGELSSTVKWIESSSPAALLAKFEEVETNLTESGARVEEILGTVQASVATDVAALGSDLTATREELLTRQAESVEREKRMVEQLSGRYEDSTLRVLETLRRRTSEVMAAARKPLTLTRALLVLQGLSFLGLAFLIYWLVSGSAG